ncbi:class I SAM-dependent methyltransferase [Cohnella hashimotonis]|uniref:Class I SAM-dependent methyltransferase n=1 Tax=Cohnella hashimotonis TaxID=2826895 RepID=A0ABT6TB93_9BACL|nr:class I SAM-dependent methyltransferase [Cohnella hashimotonis]MDI4643925.1 class I SAM-dependent methyltransferase [Cohnella hashimotonis]
MRRATEDGTQKIQRMYAENPDGYYGGANLHLYKHVRDEWREVLDVGCSEGGLGALIRGKGIRVSGIEAYPDAANAARKKLDHVLSGDIASLDLPYEAGQFDCIVFGDVLEHLSDPSAVLRKVRPYLNASGAILASLPNLAHISVLGPLLAGSFSYEDRRLLDKTQRFFTIGEIVRMFVECGYAVTMVERVEVRMDAYAPLLADLVGVCAKHRIGGFLEREATAYQYVVLAVPIQASA